MRTQSEIFSSHMMDLVNKTPRPPVSPPFTPLLLLTFYFEEFKGAVSLAFLKSTQETLRAFHKLFDGECFLLQTVG